MSTLQSAIVPQTGPFGLFLVLRVHNAQPAVVSQCRFLPTLLDQVGAQDKASQLVCAIAFGADYWAKIFAGGRPKGLKSFEAIHGDRLAAPATGGDVFVHIHSRRNDLNFMLAKQFLAPIRAYVEVLDEVYGFRYLDSRDLTGFIDGTENPEGDERAKVALIGKEEQSLAGGSYVMMQRYVHDLEKWETVAVDKQEQIIGRTKADSVELKGDKKPPTAHISRVVIEEGGEELEIVRHSMPYGTASGDSGLLFVAYGRDLAIFDKMLARMYGISGDGLHDHLMEYTVPKTGAYFFVPSLETLKQLAP
ncbi:MAG: Dyp-type peroxidase [Acidiferrobacterales bacterium]